MRDVRCVMNKRWERWRRPGREGTGDGRTMDSGWTLVEMMVVISLVVIMAGIAVISYGTATTRSREAVLMEDLFRMRDAIDQYYADRNEYPASLDMLVSEGYIRAIPDDPFTNSNTSWQTTLAEYDPSDPLSQGIYDVRSGAEGLAIDGSPYAEW
ncbi:MAG: prepilin-type N-terminal cleavage/methylation domain-containing protein [Vicinamibacterales bacterium]|nr:prepilin-type N-terminal cleavage/methylation domain-containing protein [Vicinamibacterales bacterium]